MTNKEQIKRDITVAFDFVEQIIDNPDILDKIPDGAAITFLDGENTKIERNTDKETIKKYVKVKRQFEVL
ncbi:MAG: hypothetical protein HY738_11040 [Bacteroidia bacterium]|nr:hypothetical protein [Bacteroidia bacterium]